MNRKVVFSFSSSFFKSLVKRKVLGNFYLREERVLQKCLLTLVLSLGGPRSSGCSVLPELVMMSLTLLKGYFCVHFLGVNDIIICSNKTLKFKPCYVN